MKNKTHDVVPVDVKDNGTACLVCGKDVTGIYNHVQSPRQGVAGAVFLLLFGVTFLFAGMFATPGMIAFLGGIQIIFGFAWLQYYYEKPTEFQRVGWKHDE